MSLPPAPWHTDGVQIYDANNNAVISTAGMCTIEELALGEADFAIVLECLVKARNRLATEEDGES